MVENRVLRDREFFEGCLRTIRASKGSVRLRDVVKGVIYSPASSFFLSERQYGRIIRARGIDVPRTRSGAALFYEIRRRYRRLKMNYPNMRAEAIARDIISVQCAPRFYMSVSRGIDIYYSVLKREGKNVNKKRAD